ncbi:MAG: hypothetical protein R8K22_02170 [Mariprofundaceae bacterium]
MISKYFSAILLAGFMFGWGSPSMADDHVTKTYCALASSDLEKTKQLLLNGAKRDAISEIFGELITSYSEMSDFELTQDNVRASTAGYVRIKGDPVFSNGKNFGEACVTIQAYAKPEDKAKFKSVKISNKKCTSDGDLSLKAVKKVAEEQVVVEALINYSRKLEGKKGKELLPLAHNVRYTESSFIPGTSTYCAAFEAEIFPIEIESVFSARKGKKKEIINNEVAKIHDDQKPPHKAADTPSKNMKFLKFYLQGTKSNARLNAVGKLVSKIKGNISLEELKFILADSAPYRQNVAKLLRDKLVKPLSMNFMKVVFDGESSNSRLNLITHYIGHFPSNLSLEELKFILTDSAPYHQNVAKLLRDKLANPLNMNFMKAVFDGEASNGRLNLINHYINHFPDTLSFEELEMVLANIGPYRQSALSVLKDKIP